MKKFLTLLIALTIILWFLGAEAVAIEMFGYTFDDNAFPDNANYVGGSLEYHGFTPIGDDDVDLDTALTGTDLSTYITTNGENYYIVELEFLDNYLYNGVGVDLIGFEFGTPEPFSISIFDPTANAWTSFWNVAPTDIGSINVAEIDFDHWGLASDIYVSNVIVSTEHWAASWVGADLAGFGGLNSAPVPEPATMLLVGSGLIGLVGFRRKFRKR